MVIIEPGGMTSTLVKPEGKGETMFTSHESMFLSFPTGLLLNHVHSVLTVFTHKVRPVSWCFVHVLSRFMSELLVNTVLTSKCAAFIELKERRPPTYGE